MEPGSDYHYLVRKMGLEPTHAWIKGIGFGRIEMRKNLIHRWGYDILELRSINNERKAGGFMAYALQDEKVRDSINNERLVKMLDRGIDDMEAGRELPLTEAFVKITELRNRRRNAEV